MKYVLLLISLGAIAYEDFKFRAIHWFWLLLLSAACFYFSGTSNRAIVLNIAIVVLEFAGVWMYFCLKNRGPINIFQSQIGIGDALFLISVTSLFETKYFIAALIVGLLLSLVIYQAFIKIQLLKQESTIPLAGLLSIQLIFLLFLHTLRFQTNINF